MQTAHIAIGWGSVPADWENHALRTFHLLLLAICTAAAALGGVLALTLSTGLNVRFETYLDQRDRAMLHSIADEWQNRLNAYSKTDKDQNAVRAFLVDRFAAEFHRLSVRGGAAPDPAHSTPEARRAAAVKSILPRIIVVGADGRRLFGPDLPEFRRVRSRIISQPLFANGQRIATMQLIPRPPLTLGSEQDFLLQRYRTLGWTIGGTLLAGILVAALVAGYISRWMRAVIDRLSAISSHRFDTPLPAGVTREQRQIAAGIETMAAALQAADEQRRQWLAEISHELRTPITILRGEIDALLDGLRPLDIMAMESLRDEADRLSRVTDDLHLLSVADMGGMPIHRVPADVADLCSSAKMRWSHAASEAGLTIAFAAPPDALRVRWDVDKMARAIDNLISNAIRYTAAPGMVRIACSRVGGRIVLAVDDSAPGVPPEEVERIFQPLYRVAGSRDRRSGGSGLGLAIVRAIVDGHGGTIHATASALGGLRVEITMPQAIDDA